MFVMSSQNASRLAFSSVVGRPLLLPKIMTNFWWAIMSQPPNPIDGFNGLPEPLDNSYSKQRHPCWFIQFHIHIFVKEMAGGWSLLPPVMLIQLHRREIRFVCWEHKWPVQFRSQRRIASLSTCLGLLLWWLLRCVVFVDLMFLFHIIHTFSILCWTQLGPQVPSAWSSRNNGPFEDNWANCYNYWLLNKT